MSSSRFTHAVAIASVIAAFVACTASSTASAQSTRPIVGASGTQRSGGGNLMPPKGSAFGASLDVWGTRWWQWAYSLPATGHPLFDETGADCAAGQSGPVWFLAGIFNVSGTVVRTECVVPAGKALFFPIINAEWDNVCPPADPPLTEAQLRAQAAAVVDLATDLHCDIDGESVGSLSRYRTRGPAFDIDLPADNLWGAFGCSIAPGTYSPLVQDGYYVMLTPLPPGPHTIHFSGTFADPINFTLDVTYELTVAAGHGQVAGGDPSPDVVNGGIAPASAGTPPTTTWGRMKSAYR